MIFAEFCDFFSFDLYFFVKFAEILKIDCKIQILSFEIQFWSSPDLRIQEQKNAEKEQKERWL